MKVTIVLLLSIVRFEITTNDIYILIMFNYFMSNFIFRISLCCNLYGDYCDAEEADMEAARRR